MAAAIVQRQRRRCRAAAKSQKVGAARSEAIPPSEVEAVSAEGGGSRRTGGEPSTPRYLMNFVPLSKRYSYEDKCK